MALSRSHAGIRLQAKTTGTRAAFICSPNSWRTPPGIHQVTRLFVARQNDEIRMTNNASRVRLCFSSFLLFLRHLAVVLRHSLSFRLQSGRLKPYFGRDAGNVVRYSEHPFSTTIQLFRYRDANFRIFAASLVECAGLRFKRSDFPVRRGGVSNGVAECLV